MQFKLFTISSLFVDINNTINDLINYLHKMSSLNSYILKPDKVKMFNILLFNYFLLILSPSLFHESNNSKVYNYILLFLSSILFGNSEIFLILFDILFFEFSFWSNLFYYLSSILFYDAKYSYIILFILLSFKF